MSFSDNQKLAVVLLASFIVQIPSVIWGFELCDSGFYLTFYDNIFSHPEAVQYNFMYYMNGLLGWLLLRLSGGSLVGIRIAGALVNVGVAWMAWSLLKGRRRFFPMLCAVILIGVCSWECTLTFNYDLATMLLASISLFLLVKGIDGGRDAYAGRKPRVDRRILLVVSGVVCGMNAFSRLPNFIDILFVLVIPFSSAVRPLSAGNVRKMGMWLAGWGSGVIAVLLFALAAGHWEALTSSAASMLQAGGSQRGESIHSMRHLLSSNIHVWVPIVVRAVIFGVGVVGAVLGVRRRIFGDATAKILSGMAGFAVVAAVLYCLAADVLHGWTAWLDDARVWLFAVAVGGAALAVLLKGEVFRRLRLTALCGIFMVVLLPAGSDGVVYGPGPLVLGFLLPASLCSVRDYAGPRIGRGVVAAATVLLVAAYCIKLRDGVAYFDAWPVAEMNSAIKVPEAAGLLTKPENARLYEDVFAELARQVHPGDTLMVYGSGPMVNYLTGTLPALGCSWPEQFTPGQLRWWLVESDAPEYVMMLKFQTLGRFNTCSPEKFVAGSSFDDYGNELKPYVYHTPEKSSIVFDYLHKKGYVMITDHPWFLLYKRGKSSTCN